MDRKYWWARVLSTASSTFDRKYFASPLLSIAGNFRCCRQICSHRPCAGSVRNVYPTHTTSQSLATVRDTTSTFAPLPRLCCCRVLRGPFLATHSQRLSTPSKSNTLFFCPRRRPPRRLFHLFLPTFLPTAPRVEGPPTCSSDAHTGHHTILLACHDIQAQHPTQLDVCPEKGGVVHYM